MKVINGEIDYAIETRLAKKLDKFILRCTREEAEQNAYVCFHGKTGAGKTNSSLAAAYYVRWKTERPIHLFFRLEHFIDYAKNNDKAILIYDEPAFDALSSDHTKLNTDFLRLINVMRHRRHFTIMNITKFWRFKSDLTTETFNCMIHLFTRKAKAGKYGKQKGRFYYIPRKNLENLWIEYERYHKKEYKKYKTFNGQMPNVIKKYFHLFNITVHGTKKTINNATYEQYEEMKREETTFIGEQKKSKTEQKLLNQIKELRYKISNYPKIEQEELANYLGINSRRLREWRKYYENDSFSKENEVYEPLAAANIINNMGKEEDNPPVVTAGYPKSPINIAEKPKNELTAGSNKTNN